MNNEFFSIVMRGMVSGIIRNRTYKNSKHVNKLMFYICNNIKGI
nr:hypothetical protein [uncultured Cellulosilyticum sp.]